MKKIFILVISIFIMVATCIAEEKVIIAAADPYPPFVDPEDPKEGISLVIIRAAYKTQGYKVKMEHVPWARAKAYVIKGDGKYDILPDAWIIEEEKKVMLHSTPYAVNIIKFIKRVDDTFEYTGLESLKGRKIGTVRGYGYNNDFSTSDMFTKEDAVDFITNVKKLLANRVDLTLEDEIVARIHIAKVDVSMLEKVKFIDNPLSSQDLCITVGLANPRCKEIIDAFNKGLVEIKATGEFKKIFESYGIK